MGEFSHLWGSGALFQYLIASVGLVLLIQTTGLTIYRFFFHPLAKYPGPTGARLTDLYMTALAATGKATYARYDWLVKYGNAVRTGPNELCFSDLASIKEIYGQSTEPCLKAPFFYKGFTLTGTHSVFSTTDRSIHARMRRLVSSGFSQHGVLRFQEEIVGMIELFLSILDRRSAGAVDIYDLVHSLYLDTTSQLSFAQSFRILEGNTHQGAKDIETYFSIAPLFGVFPLAKYLPFGLFRAAKDARPQIISFTRSCIDDFRERLRSGTSQNGLLRLMIEASDGETSTSFSDEELIENAVLFIIAGSGTTASTLLYLIYEVGRQPEIQRRLEDEIRTAFPDQTSFPDFEKATSLTFFNCVLQEVLRLRGPIPTVAPRISPGKVIGEHYVPAGVVVSNLAYATQRDPSVFPRPHDFNPARWMEASPEMKAMNRPFSTGPRNCLGMHLARVQLLLTVCSLYQRFDIKLDSRMTDEMMVLRDQGVMNPIGKQLWVNITPRTA